MKISSLQVLRAIAAWSVVYHHYMQIFYNFESHTPLAKLFSYRGSFGVDLFFVLSGFVMFGSASRADVSGWSFFIKRLFRVVPAYWFFTMLLILFSAFAPKAFGFTAFDAKSLLCSLFFIPHENPSGLGVYPYLTVGWTLNFEILFYTTLSLCIFLGRQYAVYLCSAIVVAFPFVFSAAESPMFSIIKDERMWQFLFGFLVAKLYWKDGATFWKNRTVGILLLVFALLMLSGVAGYGLAQRSLAAAAITMGFLVFNPFFERGHRVVSWLVKLGDYSYSTYLCHVLVIAVFLHFFGNSLEWFEESMVLGAITLSIYLLSLFSYRVVESSKAIANFSQWLIGGKRPRILGYTR